MITDDFAKVDVLLEENNQNYLGEAKIRIDTAQPKNASWVSVDAEISNGYACEQLNIIDYRNATGMADEVIRYIKTVFTPELLQLVRDGTIDNLSFRIGPQSLSSTDLNWQNGIDKLVFDKKTNKKL